MALKELVWLFRLTLGIDRRRLSEPNAGCERRQEKKPQRKKVGKKRCEKMMAWVLDPFRKQKKRKDKEGKRKKKKKKKKKKKRKALAAAHGL